MGLDIVVMAAGQGTRMKSARPKVLHPLAGRSLLQHVLDTAAHLPGYRIVAVTGHGAEHVEAAVTAPNLHFVRQQPPQGTGHAVQQALPLLADAHADGSAGVTLVLNGDVPLITAATLRALVDACAGTRLALLTVELADPTGYGRVLRGATSPADGAPAAAAGAGAIRAIVEQKDASAAERAVREVYTGAMAAPTAHLRRWLARLTNHNAQREYYLTDVVGFAVADGVPVVAAQPRDATEVLGVNSPAQLAELERLHQRAAADALLHAGVRLADPARFDLRGSDGGPADLRCGHDVSIDVGCIFEGTVELADDVAIGAYCVIRNARIGRGTQVEPYTHIDGEALGVTVGADARIGPYARLRPGAVLGDEVHIGNFVEVKNATLERGAKANHLAYLGDATVGARVNFGAGSITANYDGANKHRTTIGDDAHIGSNCVLVAPITIGDGATVGGGSTLSRDAPPHQLTVARARAVSLAGWQRPVKAPKSPPR